MPTKHQQEFCFLIFLIAMLPYTAKTQIRDWPDEEREGIKINYTEANVDSYTLPALLTLMDGKKVMDTQTWEGKRRPEIVRILVENQFGRALGNPKDVSFTVFDKGTSVFGGKALRKQVTIHFGRGPQADLLVYLPSDSEKYEVVLPFRANLGYASE